MVAVGLSGYFRGVIKEKPRHGETSGRVSKSNERNAPTTTYTLKSELVLASGPAGQSGYTPPAPLPSVGAYIQKGLLMAASVGEGVSGFVPLPGLGEFLKILITVLEACEKATAIEETVKDLHDRIDDLAVLIIAKIPPDKVISPELRAQIVKLQAAFVDILVALAKIKQQNKILLFLFPDLNKDQVDKCGKRLERALEYFDMSHNLRVDEALMQITRNQSQMVSWFATITQAIKEAGRPQNAPPAVAKDLPLVPQVFYGRESLVNDIVSLLAIERTSRVCISGLGGMGKSTLALAIIHNPGVEDLFLNYRFWVSCIEAESPDLLRRILYDRLHIKAESHDSLAPLIDALESTKARRLIVLDNFDTVYLPARNQPELRDIVTRLARLPHISLLITTRSGTLPFPEVCKWQHRELPALDEIAAKKMFQHLYPDMPTDGKLDELLSSIGRVPLAIALMAENGRESLASPADLLGEWEKAGISTIVEMDRMIDFTVNQHIVKSNPDALPLLAILSLLPGGTSSGNLRVWWGRTVPSPSSGIRALRAVGLIARGEGDSHIFVHPAIRSYMSQHEPTLTAAAQQQVHDACYDFVLTHTSIPDNRKYRDDLAAFACEEMNIQHLLMQIDRQNLTSNGLPALLAFSLYQLRTKPSEVIARRALKLSDPDTQSRYVAEAHRRLGEILSSLGHFEDACLHFEKARELFRLLPDLHTAGECLLGLLQTRVYMDESFPSALVLEMQAELCHTGDKLSMAQGLVAYARLNSSSSLDDAFEALSKAEAIFKELQCPASLSECLIHMARICTQKEEYGTASGLAMGAVNQAGNVGDPTAFGRTSSIAAGILITAGSYDEAFAVIQSAFPAVQAVGRPLAIAQMLEKLAYISAAKMEVGAARAAYTAAQENYTARSSTEMGRVGAQVCTYNLEHLERVNEDTFSELQHTKFW